MDMTTPFDRRLHRDPASLPAADQAHRLARALVLGTRILQARVRFLALDFQADAFLHHLDGAPVHGLGSGEPRRRLVQRRPGRRGVGAFDDQQWRASLDDFAGADQYRDHPPGHRRADHRLRLRAKRDTARQGQHGSRP